jgi:sulfoxide reductase heme-binding subunit YedZ
VAYDATPRLSRSQRRLRQHLGIALAALITGVVVGAAFEPGDARSKLSAATAYIATTAVGLSLILGPLNLLRGRPNPVSSDLRRDLGIWGAIIGLVHVGVGLTVHFRGRMHLYFLPPSEAHALVPIRLDAFGLANYLGAFAGGVLLLLLLISSDRALRWLGARRWKAWQRLSYAGALATLGHGVLYQLLERRRLVLVVLFGTLAAVALIFQSLGIRAVRSRRGRFLGGEEQ